MPYTHFRYIAYEVPTVFNQDSSFLYTLPPGDITAPPPLREAITAMLAGTDALTRMQRFISVLLAAQAHVAANCADDDNTLKIFMAPEFYFRPHNDDKAYSYSQYQGIKKVLRATINGDAKFKHWLVIPGSIIWIWKNEYAKDGKRKEIHPDLKVYMNTTLIIKDDLKRVIEKTEASPRDGKPGGEDRIESHDARAFARYYYSDEKLIKHFFTIDGLNLGLEVCLEHSLGILKKNISTVGHAATGIDLQLLTAGGMQMDKKAIVAKAGGFVLRADGFTPELQYADPPRADLSGCTLSADDVDKEETDAPVPTLIKDFTNMRKVIKYRELFLVKEEEKGDKDRPEKPPAKVLRDGMPGTADSFPFLMRMTRKADVDITPTSNHLTVTETMISTNAMQKIRVFERYAL